VRNGNFWVAIANQEVVGTVALLDIGNRQAALRKMFVHRAYRGDEIGTARCLLGTLLDWSRTNGFHEIFPGTTPRFLAAHRFYEKNGFGEIAESDLPAAFPIMTVDKKFYRRVVEATA
jgi:N-acetylglutamate synthase-like GNAT family acetyltransferase